MTLADHPSRASEDAELRPFHSLDESMHQDNVVNPLASHRDRRRFTGGPRAAETAEALLPKEKNSNYHLVTQGDLREPRPQEIPSQPGRVRDWFYGNVVTHRR